ncbi:MAG TPA: glycine oxidase ThiO [Minicystis sp.]|nr:glycine oxidase ThiO [Minicystis sp.]
MTPGADALVVGGGVIGAAVALALAERGAAVELVDGSSPALGPAARAPATLAAAGILGAQMEAHGDGPLERLCLASRARFEAFARHVEELAGANVEYRPCGVSIAAFGDEELARLDAATAWQRSAGLRVERLDARRAREAEPGLNEAVAGAMHFPDDARVDPPSLFAAVRAAAVKRGAKLRFGRVERVTRDGARVTGAIVDGEAVPARRVIVCAGAWSGLVGGAGLGEGDVQPARGQMLELVVDPGTVRAVVLGPDAYLSPRDDGRVLVGSTVELAGFHADVTAAAARDLLAGATRLVPALERAKLSRFWAGLRPYTPDELPLIGPAVYDGLLLATGHFRNGVLLAPITAEIVAALVAGAPPPVDVAPFAPSRLARLAAS